MDSSWWDWDRGSAPFFWHFTEEWQPKAQDGLKLWFLPEPPKWRQPQQVNQDTATLQQEQKKISKAWSYGYIGVFMGVLSLLFFFSVLKGDSDI